MKALAGNSSKNVEEIQQMMPEEFNRKLKEWELIKEGKPGSPRYSSSTLMFLFSTPVSSNTKSPFVLIIEKICLVTAIRRISLSLIWRIQPYKTRSVATTKFEGFY